MATYDLTSSIPTSVKTGDILNCPYSGTYKTITLPRGTYKLEVWGAQGGSINSTYYGGKGGYSVGKLTLSESTTVYVYVGGQGTGGTTTGEKAGGFNGGGRCYTSAAGYANGSGGGASDVRIGQDSLYARVIVAGGGGGAGSYSSSYRYVGGYGGGTTGGRSSYYSTYPSGEAGTQTSGGVSHAYTYADPSTGELSAFGKGGGAKESGGTNRYSGGGSGWYGGGLGGRAPGGGGSGYIYTAETASNYPSGCLLDSSMYLTDADTIAGNASMPSTSDSTETGHEGNGYVRITVIKAVNLPFRFKVGGEIVEASAAYTKVDGEWKEISAVYYKSGGTWQDS